VEQHQATLLWISQSEHNRSHSLEQPSLEKVRTRTKNLRARHREAASAIFITSGLPVMGEQSPKNGCR
jgi:hypothetical protein